MLASFLSLGFVLNVGAHRVTVLDGETFTQGVFGGEPREALDPPLRRVSQPLSPNLADPMLEPRIDIEIEIDIALLAVFHRLVADPDLGGRESPFP